MPWVLTKHNFVIIHFYTFLIIHFYTWLIKAQIRFIHFSFRWNNRKITLYLSLIQVYFDPPCSVYSTVYVNSILCNLRTSNKNMFMYWNECFLFVWGFVYPANKSLRSSKTILKMFGLHLRHIKKFTKSVKVGSWIVSRFLINFKQLLLSEFLSPGQ